MSIKMANYFHQCTISVTVSNVKKKKKTTLIFDPPNTFQILYIITFDFALFQNYLAFSLTNLLHFSSSFDPQINFQKVFMEHLLTFYTKNLWAVTKFHLRLH